MKIDSAYMNLMYGIIRLAVQDWKKALRMLEKDPDNTEAKSLKKDCEDFFTSDEYADYYAYSDGGIPQNMMEALA